MDKFRKYLDAFNNNELDVEGLFGDYDTWFGILKSRDLIGEVDMDTDGHDDWQNQLLLWLYNDGQKEKFNYWMDKFLGDVEFDNGVPYLIVGSRGDLATLFCNNNRYDISRDTIESLLIGEDVFEPYWETTDNVYRDVIEELNEKNVSRLKEYMLKGLKGQQLSPETEEMELIAAEQGHNNFWEINEENVARILDDEESMISLLGDELSDLKSELYSIHSSAYNSAYESDVWEELFDELGEYFEGHGEFITRPHPYKKDTQQEYFKIPISDFYGVITDFLDDNKRYGPSGTLEYEGSFINIVSNTKDCLSVRIPDYPDSGKVDKNINSYFEDYI
jgi:hypothetical protein